MENGRKSKCRLRCAYRKELVMIIEIMDEIGNVDLCEVEPEPSTRVIRVIKRVRTAEGNNDSNREYELGYTYACGYKE